jgi:hypothetical protein
VKDFSPNFVFGHVLSRWSLRRDFCAIVAAGVFILGIPQLRSQTHVQPSVKPGSKSATSSAASKIAAIKSFRIVQEKDGQAVEILATKPLVPSIQAIADPDRLVIDLPNARLDAKEKRISVEADQISALRADQFQQNPPITRVVVDLLAPRTYTWDAAGNRLVIHLGRSPSQAQVKTSPFEPATVPTLTPTPQPVVSVVRAPGPLVLAGDSGTAVSSVTAGPDTAILRLSSGGEVHVCPGTTVSVTPSQNRHNVMFGMNTGALEAHFGLDASSDTVMTPDFRILLVGPGQFHYAVSADNQGNTCVRALSGNTASAIVTELLGDRTYQVKATEQLVFHSGQLDRVDMAVPLECGCPPPRNPPLRATNNLPPLERAPSDRLPTVNANSAPTAETAYSGTGPSTPEAAPVDATIAANELHVQVEAPFVFHATGPPPAPVEDVRALPLDSRPRTAPAMPVPLPPPAEAAPKSAGGDPASANHPPQRGFFRKLGGFFAALFR